MAEVAAESTHVPSHKARSALFLAAMRHFRDELRGHGFRVEYRELGAHAEGTLGHALGADLARLQPERVVMVTPGEHRVAAEIGAAVRAAAVPIETRDDSHFFITPGQFDDWARGRKELRLEHFYRWMRRRTGLLMDGDQPAGGRWNFDAENRASFGKGGPGWLPAPLAFPPDATTRAVLDLVERQFPTNPGRLDAFDWPVTRAQALAALEDFVAHRLPCFGRWQDAMWQGEPWLYHSRLSAALNLKLLSPREVCAAAERAWREGFAPLEGVEGFVRQVLGWREYVRGIYWREMPGYLELNRLGADRSLPAFYWSGETDLACLRETISQTLALGYAHHIQRLMVTGLFALLLGRSPPGGARVVSGGLRGRGRMGRAAQHARHVAVRRRRAAGLEALRGHGQVRCAHGQRLRRLPLPAGPGPRRGCLPIHDAVLGFPGAASRALCAPPAARAAGAQPRPVAGRRAQRDRGTGGGVAAHPGPRLTGLCGTIRRTGKRTA